MQRHPSERERLAEVEILKYILKNYFSTENADNRGNKKAIMEVWRARRTKPSQKKKKKPKQINISVISGRLGSGRS